MFMGDSLSKVMDAATRAEPPVAERLPKREPCKKSLYRKLTIAAIAVAGWLAIGTASLAQRPQLKRPEEAPEKPPEPKPKKNVRGPRAIGVLQINASGKDTLIPVAILVDGKFYDASSYKADPVPMALESGTVYEVEKSGDSQGLFTVRGALHSSNTLSATPWLGSGSYVLNGAEPAKTTHKAEDKPRDLESDNDAPPRLTKGKSETGTNSNPGSASGGEAGAKPDTAQKGEKPSGSGKAAESQSAGSSPGGGAASSSGTSPGQQSAGAQSGTGQSAGQQKAGQDSASRGGGGELPEAGNYYRPTLRRGKPTETAPDETQDQVTAKAGDPGKAADAAGDMAEGQFIPAVSDAGGPQPEPFVFFWKEGEEADREKQMLTLAKDEVKAYVKAREQGAIAAKPTSPASKATSTKTGASSKKTAVQSDPAFEKVQFRGFDLWRNNQPVMVLTAEAHFPPKAGTSEVAFIYNVTVAARTDIYGDLRKLYAGVTDKFHLDVTPRLELIDAVDADGDKRGELLFRETTDGGNGFLIYRATGDTLWKMFDSLNQ